MRVGDKVFPLALKVSFDDCYNELLLNLTRAGGRFYVNAREYEYEELLRAEWIGCLPDIKIAIKMQGVSILRLRAPRPSKRVKTSGDGNSDWLELVV